MKQKELFNEHTRLSHRLRDIGGHMQNDFSRMLEDGYATPEQIQTEYKNYLQEVSDFMESYSKLNRATTEYYKTVLENYQNT